MEKSVPICALFALLLAVSSVPVFGSDSGESVFPDGETVHPEDVTVDDVVVYCSYNDTICYYRNYIYTLEGTPQNGDGTPQNGDGTPQNGDGTPQNGDGTSIPVLDDSWSVLVNGDKEDIISDTTTGSITASPNIITVILQSDILTGVKCLWFSAFSSRHPINWALSIRNAHRETFVGLRGNQKHAKKITVGIESGKPYIIAFHLYGFEEHDRPTIGSAYIGRIFIVDGPCVEDQPQLNCTFDDGFCNWNLHNAKFVWYQVPFGLHHTIPHAIEWGALAAFAGKGALWSPVVRTFNVKCFSFIYAKGESTESYLRVWLLYRIPGFKDIKTLLYEDALDRKILKKHVQISIYVPYDFQIAFEGRSKTILHGVIVLHTAISEHFCEGTGDYIDLKPTTPEIDGPGDGDGGTGATSSQTPKVTTPTTAFAPL